MWVRDEVFLCNCFEKCYRYVYCWCLRCKGKIIIRKTELWYWVEVGLCVEGVLGIFVFNSSDLDEESDIKISEMGIDGEGIDS